MRGRRAGQWRWRLVTLVALTGLGSGAAPLWGQDATWVHTTTVELRDDNRNGVDLDDRYGVLINRLNFQGHYDKLTASFRADLFRFWDPPTGDQQNDLLLERLTVSYRSGAWTVTAGDFFQQLGRGIALSLRKVEETGVDVSIQGGRVELSAGDHQALVFAGRVNAANLDEVSQKRVEDPKDVVTGFSYTWTWLPVATSLFGVYMETQDEILGHPGRTATVGGSLELFEIGEWAALYVEGDVQHRESAGVGCGAFKDPCGGYAGYATLDVYFGSWAWLVEGLYLRGFELRGSRNTALEQAFVYNLPPTLERVDQELMNQRDVQGVRLHGEVEVAALEMVLAADFTYRQNDPGTQAQVDAWHGHGKVQWRHGTGKLWLSGGYREEHSARERLRAMAHGELDWRQELGGALGLHGYVQHQEELDATRSGRKGTALLGLEWRQVGSLTADLGYDTVNSRAGVRQWFLAGIATVELWTSVQARLVAGTQRGGLRCVAGVCRDFPGFAGARAEVVARF